MKQIAVMFALLFVVALIFPAEAPAPNITTTTTCEPTTTTTCKPTTTTTICDPCGDGEWDSAVEECDYTAYPTGCDKYEVCTEECICEPVDPCGDGEWDPAVEECDYTAYPTGCDKYEVCTEECICEPCEPGICEPRTQGFWKRVCDGVYGNKVEHPETPKGFSEKELCGDLMVRGNDRNDPCVRSASQIAALKLNNKYGILDDSCKVYYYVKVTTVGDVLDEIDSLECKEAADLAEAINSGDAL